ASVATSTNLDYTLMFNQTDNLVGAAYIPNPYISVMTDLMNSAYIKWQHGVSVLRGVKPYPTLPVTTNISIIGLLALQVLTLSLHLLIPYFLVKLVADRQYKIREQMEAHGLGTSVYVGVMFLFFFCFSMVAMGIMYISGLLFDMHVFVDTSGPALVYFAVVWAVASVAFTFFLAPFLPNERMATVLGWCLVLVLCQTKSVYVFIYPIDKVAAWAALPSIGGGQLLHIMSEAESFTLTDAPAEFWQISAIVLVSSVLLFMLGAWLDHHLADIVSSVKSFIKVHTSHACDIEAVTPPLASARATSISMDESREVLAHKEMLLDMAKLRVTYPNPGGAPKEAVKGINITGYSGEILGILGPNGSGKTTTIRSLLGAVECSGQIQGAGSELLHTDRAHPK
ncbi:ABC transporter A, ABCA, partial [Kipferlia bialata]